jgi:hypothetical protein
MLILTSYIMQPVLTGSNSYSHSSQGDPDFAYDPIKALKFQLTRSQASLGPGFQFAFRALQELGRTCGIIDTHNSSERTLLVSTKKSRTCRLTHRFALLQDATISGGQSIAFSTPSPSSTSPPSSCGPVSDKPALASESDARRPAPTGGADQVDWNISDMTMPTFGSSADGGTQSTTLHLPDQFRESLFQSQERLGQGNEPLSSELCQRMLLDLAILQEKEGWRP